MSWGATMLAELAVPGGPALVLARGSGDAALLVGFGAPLFRLLLLRGLAGRGQRRLELAALVGAALLTLVWAALQSVQIAGDLSGFTTVLSVTVFGHLILARLALIAVALLSLVLGLLPLGVVAAGLALASMAGHGHAFAMDEGPSQLLASELLHLLAAGAWLGALPSLALFVCSRPVQEGAAVAHRFTPLGTVCVLVLALTATDQGAVLIGGLPGWVGTGHGLVATLKLLLFAVLLGFAARHRWRLVPGLEQGGGSRALARSIAAEALVGLAIVLAAAWLANLRPAMHGL